MTESTTLPSPSTDPVATQSPVGTTSAPTEAPISILEDPPITTTPSVPVTTTDMRTTSPTLEATSGPTPTVPAPTDPVITGSRPAATLPRSVDTPAPTASEPFPSSTTIVPPTTDVPTESTVAPVSTTLALQETPTPSFPTPTVANNATSTPAPAGNNSNTSTETETRAEFSEPTPSFGERVAHSANMLVASAVAANVVSIAITAVTSGSATVTGATTIMTGGIAATQGLLIPGVTGSALGHSTMPVADAGALLMLLNYLQFIASGSHMSLPGAPNFFHQFTDSLGWSVLQPTSPVQGDGHGKTAVNSTDMSRFSAADGDIIAGVLAYAQRINVKPDELFTKTIIAFASVVGAVAAIVAILYALVKCIAKKRLEMVVQRLKDLPRAKLLMRLLTQSCLSICLMSEYALSMTSSFQMRYFHQNDGGYGAFASATAALIVVCFGLIVLGVAKLWNKSEEQLNDPDFKFAWGSYYKYFRFSHRYFFVAKMGAEILSGVVIGLVSDVPTQITLLMGLQLSMFLYTVESSPYSMTFQTVCSSTAFVMKMITYALISCFLTKSTEESVRDFVATLVVVLQVTLLLLFNSRQLYILYKQMRYLIALRRMRIMQDKNAEGLPRELDNESTTRGSLCFDTSNNAFTPTDDGTRATFGSLHSKRNSMVSNRPLPLPVVGG